MEVESNKHVELCKKQNWNYLTDCFKYTNDVFVLFDQNNLPTKYWYGSDNLLDE